MNTLIINVFFRLIIITIFFSGTFGCSILTGGNETGPSTVGYVNLSRYTGTWYEIGRLPNRFQADCTKNTTATYVLRDDGKIEVVNRCTTSENEIIEAQGIARIVDAESNAKLEVSFFNILGLYLFWGDYWIIGLDNDYRYAVVGTPSHKYGWILSRTPDLSTGDLQNIKEILINKGYDFEKFQMTKQDK